MPARAALLMDGGYVIVRLRRSQGIAPSATDISQLAARLIADLPGQHDLYRVFFYHAEPYQGSVERPLGGGVVKFAETTAAVRNRRLLRELEQTEDFAVRRGEVRFRGWELRASVSRALQRRRDAPISASDFVPKIRQKGVDMRIGLDMAALALKRLVSTVVVVSGDSDMVPAMRFARREGLRVGLCPLGFAGIRRELRAHADFIVDWPGSPDPGASASSPEDPSTASPAPAETRW